jgi:hypothetical protein
MADIANTSNQPFHWGYFAETFRMFPAPSTAGLTVRVGGNFAVSAPTTDGEMGNSWMVEGENLIRCHAKFELYTHVLANAEAAARLHPDNPLSPTAMALSALRRRSTAKALAGGSYVTPWGL